MSDDAVLAAIAALSVQLSHNSDQVSIIMDQMTIFAVQVSRLGDQGVQTRAEIMERIDRLQNRFDEMRAEVNANFNNASRIEDRGKATQDELRAMVEQYTFLHRRYHNMDERLRALEGK